MTDRSGGIVLETLRVLRELGPFRIYVQPVSLSAEVVDRVLPPSHAKNPSTALSMMRSLQMTFVLGYLLPGLPPLGVAHRFHQPVRAVLASAGAAWLMLPAAAIVVIHLRGRGIRWSKTAAHAEPLRSMDHQALWLAAALGVAVGTALSFR
jgi:hypothetical protein